MQLLGYPRGPWQSGGAVSRFQSLKAIQRPMFKKSPQAAAWGDDYQESQWRVAERKPASILKAINTGL
ncbi:unnamed protein product, partial [Staurois parvus]